MIYYDIMKPFEHNLIWSRHSLFWQEVVPSYLATSPIMSTGEELMESQLGRGSSRHHGRLVEKRHFCLKMCALFFTCLHATLLCRHHPLCLTSCSEPWAAAKWCRDDQKEEEKEKEGTARGRRRREERGEWGGVLRRWGHVYHRLELGWGQRGGRWRVSECVHKKCVCFSLNSSHFQIWQKEQKFLFAVSYCNRKDPLYMSFYWVCVCMCVVDG